MPTDDVSLNVLKRQHVHVLTITNVTGMPCGPLFYSSTALGGFGEHGRICSGACQTAKHVSLSDSLRIGSRRKT